ncbi:MAG TPA: BamA/TamA family outer membrane protein [Longimicrobiaceae bacterium]|nr:BamA/TamA family outer membrane protein [Longimicrobiaceae bacterium]
MFRQIIVCNTFAAAALVLLSLGRLDAQVPAQEESPRVERITFRGADALRRGELRTYIITDETRCRGILFRPFCWVFPNSPLFVERHYLMREELPRDELRLRVHYFRRGYRETEVTSEVRPRGRGVEVVFTIEEGPPTVVAAARVEQTRPVVAERRLRRLSLPQEGKPLDLIRLDSARAELAQIMGERGYLDAEVRDTIVIADRRADVELIVETGPRTTLEEIQIEGNRQIEESTMRRAMPVRIGEVLRSTDVVAAQRALYESNLFHEALVSVPEETDSAKTLAISVREAPVRGARLGGGFNTVEFVQTEGRFTHYNWLGDGRRLDLRATVGNLFAPQLNGTGIFRDVLPRDFGFADEEAFLRPTWLVSAELTQPAFRSSNNTAAISAFAHRRTVPGIVIDRGVGANLSITRRLQPRTPATLNYRFEVTTVEAGDVYFCVNYGVCDLPTIDALRARQRLSPASLNFFADRADDPLSPTTGYNARLDLEHASSFTISDFRYNRVAGDVTRYFPFRQGRHVLAARTRVGWVRPLESTAAAVGVGGEIQALLHPRKRFYAGGSQSVRGYGENQLGPRILTISSAALRGLTVENGDTTYVCAPARNIVTCDPNASGIGVDDFVPRPLGGSGVIEGNLEYRFPVWGALGAALFVDGAIVGDPADVIFTEGTGAITPGFGIRYQSPVGPIRVDLGVKPTLVENLPVVTEMVDEEGNRRIVRLPQMRRYDPLEESGGFFREVLERLTLHLSIGQAF